MRAGSLRQSAIGNARLNSRAFTASTIVMGVVFISRPVGSKVRASSSEKMSSPSVEAAAHERPSGEKRTLAQRIASFVTRSDRRARVRGAPPITSSSSES
eukprot:scaffold314064_cov32-Tisochrysis_lutea.AAC.4